MPEDRSEIEAFELEANPLWSRAGYDSFEVGFSIDASPKGRFFERYVDYLAWKSRIPEGDSTGREPVGNDSAKERRPGSPRG